MVNFDDKFRIKDDNQLLQLLGLMTGITLGLVIYLLINPPNTTSFRGYEYQSLIAIIPAFLIQFILLRELDFRVEEDSPLKSSYLRLYKSGIYRLLITLLLALNWVFINSAEVGVLVFLLAPTFFVIALVQDGYTFWLTLKQPELKKLQNYSAALYFLVDLSPIYFALTWDYLRRAIPSDFGPVINLSLLMILFVVLPLGVTYPMYRNLSE